MLRNDASVNVRKVWKDSLDLLRIAEQGGMVTAWAAEHHGLEFWHAPNPLTILTDWAARTRRSLELFVERVMPRFESRREAGVALAAAGQP